MSHPTRAGIRPLPRGDVQKVRLVHDHEMVIRCRVHRDNNRAQMALLLATDYGTRRSVSLSKVYKTEDGKWLSSKSFRSQDLPVLGTVVAEAYAVVRRLDTESKAETPASERSPDEST